MHACTVIHPLDYLPNYLSTCLPIRPSAHLPPTSLPISLYLLNYLSLSLFIYLSIYLSIYLYISLYIYLSTYLSIYLYIYLTIYPSTHLPICQRCLPINSSAYPPVYLSAYPLIDLSTFLPIYLPPSMCACIIHSHIQMHTHPGRRRDPVLIFAKCVEGNSGCSQACPLLHRQLRLCPRALPREGDRLQARLRETRDRRRLGGAYACVSIGPIS